MARIDEDLLLEVRRRVDIERVVGGVVTLKRRGPELNGLCPFHNEKTGSFTVVPKKKFFHCFGCGAHGDAIGFTMRIAQVSYPDAVRLLATDLGLDVDRKVEIDPKVKAARDAAWAAEEAARLAEEKAEREESIAWCAALWRAAKGQPEAKALRYLAGRAIRLDTLPPTIRCAPLMRHRESRRAMPCMVAAIQAVGGEVVGVHRTFLKADGSAKTDQKPAKKMNGVAWGGAVRLSPAASTLVVGEGIETVLSMRQALAGQDGFAFWAALSLGNLSGSGRGLGAPHPERRDASGRPQRLPSARPDMERPGLVLPDWAREVVILADADNGDPFAAEQLLLRAAKRFQAQGRAVRIARPPEGADFNDVLRGVAA